MKITHNDTSLVNLFMHFVLILWSFFFNFKHVLIKHTQTSFYAKIFVVLLISFPNTIDIIVHNTIHKTVLNERIK